MQSWSGDNAENSATEKSGKKWPQVTHFSSLTVNHLMGHLTLSTDPVCKCDPWPLENASELHSPHHYLDIHCRWSWKSHCQWMRHGCVCMWWYPRAEVYCSGLWWIGVGRQPYLIEISDSVLHEIVISRLYGYPLIKNAGEFWLDLGGLTVHSNFNNHSPSISSHELLFFKRYH